MNINILGHKLEIKELKRNTEDLGQFDREQHIIYLNIKMHKKRKLDIMKTLRHECIHAAFEITGLNANIDHDLEEQIVQMLDINWENVNTAVDAIDPKSFGK